MIEHLLIKEDELYFKEFIDILVDNGYCVTLRKIQVLTEIQNDKDIKEIRYVVDIED